MAKIHTLTYNGTKSSDLGVFVSGSGSFDAAELDVDKYEIPGRNGDLILSNNRYKNIEITYPAFIPKAFMDKVQNVRNWLRASKVYARLEDTYDMEHYRLGLASGIQSFEPVNRNDASNFQLSFDCRPERFLKTGETPLPVVPEAHTYSGEIVEFETVAVDDLTKAEVSLSPIQSGSGYPSPNNIRPITGHDSATLNIGAEYPTADETYPVSFPQTVYGCTFDWVSGKLKVTHRLASLDGTENWKASTVYLYVFGYDAAKNTGGSTQICSHFLTTYSYGGDVVFAQTNGAIIKGGETDVAAWKAYLAQQYSNGTPVQLCYELATPVEIDLTPTEVQTLLGLNNVWASDGSVEIAYSDPFNVDNPTFFASRPLFTITNPAQNDVLNVNGMTITFLDSYTGTVTIDCETMNAFSGAANLNGIIQATDFPVLVPGTNIVTWTGAGECTMTPRWWEL